MPSLVSATLLKPREQIAALPVRRLAEGGFEVLLVTSRETRRWIIPKGWPERGLKGYETAALEAYEEAGIVGAISKRAVGTFRYVKRLADKDVLCEVKVYLLEVEKQAETWREQGQRDFEWVAPEVAADRVEEPGLRSLLLTLKLPQKPLAKTGAKPKRVVKAKAKPAKAKKADASAAEPQELASAAKKRNKSAAAKSKARARAQARKGKSKKPQDAGAAKKAKKG